MPRDLLKWAVPCLVVALAAGCGGARRERLEAQLLGADQVYRTAVAAIEARDLAKAKRLLEGIEYSRDDRVRLEPLVRLRLADISFYTGTGLSLIDARSMYLNFVTLYTDHPLAPYAQLQAGVCSLRQANHPARDQTETEQAIVDLRRVRLQYPDSPYAVAAEDRIEQAQSTLAEHEFVVGKFYLKRGAYAAAISRFEGILERFPAYPHRDRLLFHLGKALVLGEKPQEARIHLERLQREYPAGDWAREADVLIARLAS